MEPYAAVRPLPRDPRLDLAAGSLDLHHGRIRYVHPRDPAALLYEEDIAADEAYPPYWAEVWPSGTELAYAVSARSWSGVAVLELGCGLGLPSIAAALGGARVLATDRSPDALAFAAANAEQNGVVLETAVCSWADAEELVERGPWGLVLAADVLYGQRNVDELLALLPRLVGSDPDPDPGPDPGRDSDSGPDCDPAAAAAAAEVWVADPQRPLAPAFLAAARGTWRSVLSAPTRAAEVQIHRLAGPARS